MSHTPVVSRLSVGLLAGALMIAPSTAVAADEPVAVPPAPPADASPLSVRHRVTAPTVPLPRGFRPEGIAAGPGSSYFAGSLADGRVWIGDVHTRAGRVLVPGLAGRQLRGLQWDRRSGLLWAAGNVGDTAKVFAFNGRSGQIVHRIIVRGGGFLNDLVVTPRAVWVTDSRVDRLTRIPLDRHGHPRGGYRHLPLTGAWSTDGSLRANGIRALADGTLVVAHSGSGLFTVDPRTGAATRLPVRGRETVTGGDGLVLHGRTLFVVRGHSQAGVAVLRLSWHRGGWRASWRGELTDRSLDVPSTADVVDGRLWAVNARFGAADPDGAAYWATGLALPHRPS